MPITINAVNIIKVVIGLLTALLYMLIFYIVIPGLYLKELSFAFKILNY